MTFDDVQKAIKKGDLNQIRSELEGGLDPNLSNRYSWTLLMVVAMNGNTGIGRLLIEHGAELDARNKFGDTALSLAAHTGHPSFVKLLLDHGARLDGYPFGNSFEDFLDWAQRYGTGTLEAMEKTRAIVRATRESRKQDIQS